MTRSAQGGPEVLDGPLNRSGWDQSGRPPTTQVAGP